MDTKLLEKLAGFEPHSDIHPFCLNCGYDMFGSESGICPECGTPFVRSQWRKEVDQLKMQILDVEDRLEFVPLAWKFVVAGLVIRLVGIVLPWGNFGTYLTKGACIVACLAGFFLALNVFRVRSLPGWAREKLSIKPDFNSAYIGIVGGSLLIASAFLLP